MDFLEQVGPVLIPVDCPVDAVRQRVLWAVVDQFLRLGDVGDVAAHLARPTGLDVDIDFTVDAGRDLFRHFENRRSLAGGDVEGRTLDFLIVVEDAEDSVDTVVKMREIEYLVFAVDGQWLPGAGLGDKQRNHTVGCIVPSVNVREPEDTRIDAVTVLVGVGERFAANLARGVGTLGFVHEGVFFAVDDLAGVPIHFSAAGEDDVFNIVLSSVFENIERHLDVVPRAFRVLNQVVDAGSGTEVNDGLRIRGEVVKGTRLAQVHLGGQVVDTVRPAIPDVVDRRDISPSVVQSFYQFRSDCSAAPRHNDRRRVHISLVCASRRLGFGSAGESMTCL